MAEGDCDSLPNERDDPEESQLEYYKEMCSVCMTEMELMRNQLEEYRIKNICLIQENKIILEDLKKQVEIRSSLQMQKEQANIELEELTGSLFEEANALVAEESKSRHIAELNLERTKCELGHAEVRLEEQSRQLDRLRDKIDSISSRKYRISEISTLINLKRYPEENTQSSSQENIDILDKEEHTTHDTECLLQGVSPWTFADIEIMDKIEYPKGGYKEEEINFYDFESIVEAVKSGGTKIPKIRTISNEWLYSTIDKSQFEEFLVLIEKNKKEQDNNDEHDGSIDANDTRCYFWESCDDMPIMFDYDAHPNKKDESSIDNMIQVLSSQTSRVKDSLLKRIFDEDIDPNMTFPLTKKSFHKKLLISIYMNTLNIFLSCDKEAVSCDLCGGSLQDSRGMLSSYKLEFVDDKGIRKCYNIDCICRNKIVSVCDFFSFIRYCKLGLYNHMSDHRLFSLFLKIRRNMFYSKTGSLAILSIEDLSKMEDTFREKMGILEEIIGHNLPENTPSTD